MFRTLLTVTAHDAGNQLLAALDERERARWQPYLERVELRAREEIFDRQEALEYLWFPEGGPLSQLIESSTGGSVDVMTVGREGVVGLAALFGAVSSSRVISHVNTTALRIRIGEFLRLVDGGHPLMRHLEHYAALLISCLAQISACNTLHTAEQRLCRWLSLAHDCAQSEQLEITHDSLALMLGTRRASVTRAAQRLQQQGAITYERGVVQYADVAQLERLSCECRAIVRGLHQTFKNFSTSPITWHY